MSGSLGRNPTRPNRTLKAGRFLGVGAVIGGLVYAAAGGVMAANNLDWLELRGGANSLFVWLGAGLALVVVAFGVVHGRDIWSHGPRGIVASVSGVLAPVILLMSPLIQFAIFGTFATWIAIAAFTVTVHRGRLLPRGDVALLAVATVASATWNTETPSAALLIVVGVAAAWISYRALLSDWWGADAGAAA
ncbi:MAG TPA: hypothetical protein VNE62_03905 [Actinomycetota bacterium]|nr:hypothetical protein [Actinomycetota bacterium]